MASPDDDTNPDNQYDGCLRQLLEGNDRHVAELPNDYFESVRDAQHPDVVTICCADSRVPQEGMWSVDEPGTVFTPSNIGNQVWDEHDGTTIVDGSLLYPIHCTDTNAIAVVGHTGCGAVTAAYQAATGGELPGPAGVSRWIESLVPVIEAGLESELTDDSTSAGSAVAVESGNAESTDGELTAQEEWRLINQLVEYNVDHQTSFLRASDDVPETVATYGFVYDFHGVYGSDPGRAYLVNLEGETHPDRIRERVPEAYANAVSSLLY